MSHPNSPRRLSLRPSPDSSVPTEPVSPTGDPSFSGTVFFPFRVLHATTMGLLLFPYFRHPAGSRARSTNPHHSGLDNGSITVPSVNISPTGTSFQVYSTAILILRTHSVLTGMSLHKPPILLSGPIIRSSHSHHSSSDHPVSHNWSSSPYAGLITPK